VCKHDYTVFHITRRVFEHCTQQVLSRDVVMNSMLKICGNFVHFERKMISVSAYVHTLIPSSLNSILILSCRLHVGLINGLLRVVFL
jgi:hypothetical protein